MMLSLTRIYFAFVVCPLKSKKKYVCDGGISENMSLKCNVHGVRYNNVHLATSSLLNGVGPRANPPPPQHLEPSQQRSVFTWQNWVGKINIQLMFIFIEKSTEGWLNNAERSWGRNHY